MTKLRPSFILKMGFSGASPIRYIVTILIAVIAFALFGAAACVGFTDISDMRENVLYGDGYIISADGAFGENDVSAIEEASSTPIMLAADCGEVFPEINRFLGTENEWQSELLEQDYFAADYIGALAYVSEEYLTASGYTLTGRLPQNDDEVAIPKCLANTFLWLGYYDDFNYPGTATLEGWEKNDEGKIHITDLNDLVSGTYKIACNISGEEKAATIVGVVDYGDCPYYYIGGYTDDVYDKVFVTKNFLAEAFKTSRGEEGLADNVIAAKGKTAAEQHKLYTLVSESETFYFNSQGLSGLADKEEDIEQFRNTFAIIGVGLAVFSGFLTHWLMAVSIDSKKLEIAILRAIGAGKKDVAAIFIIECIAVAIIQAAIATGICAALCVIINAIAVSGFEVAVNMVSFSPLAAVIIFALSIVISLVSSAPVIYRTANKSPVEAIRENQE